MTVSVRGSPHIPPHWQARKTTGYIYKVIRRTPHIKRVGLQMAGVVVEKEFCLLLYLCACEIGRAHV